MKTKDITLAFIAFTFAIAGAFASLLPIPTVYVKAKLSPSPLAPTVCVNTDVTCEGMGDDVCTVELRATTGYTSACSNGYYVTYTAGCTTPLFAPFPVRKLSTVEVFRLVDN